MLILPPGYPILTLAGSEGRTITVTPQLEFTRNSKADFHSESFSQIPDITIEVRRGDNISLFVFDPKYKLFSDATGSSNSERPVKEDIDKMHSYRDAIRDSNNRRPVHLAAIFYPGPEQWFGDGVVALHAMPGEDNTRAALSDLLREIISVDGGRWSRKSIYE